MPAPIAKGVIIAASILVAAGLALYESPQVRQWVEQSRRKIALALHSLGDEIQPHSRYQSPEQAEEARRKRREEIIRRNRAELLRQAREEGIAIDLDELQRVAVAAEVECAEMEAREMQEEEDRKLAERLQAEWAKEEGGNESQQQSRSADMPGSFDHLVGEDGKLRESGAGTATTATATEMTERDSGLRRRGRSAFEQGAAFANPFADDEAQIIFDQHLVGAEEDEGHADQPIQHESRETTATLEGDYFPSSAPWRSTEQLIDLSPATGSRTPKSVHEDQDQDSNFDLYQSASIHSLPSAPLSPRPHTPHYEPSSPFADPSTPPAFEPSISQAQSFHSFAGPDRAGAATPTNDSFSSFSSAASHADSRADDIAMLDELDELDARSEAFTDGGFSDVSAPGARTPSEWTDVGSVSGSEMGEGRVHQ